MSIDNAYRRKRLELARIAREEGSLALAGDENLAGPAIEKYLAVFREAFNKNGYYVKYSDTRIGYPWCCAFVYYCCLQAGFSFPAKPDSEFRYTLGAVRTWYEWATLPDTNFYFSVHDQDKVPEPGNIVLFDHLIENVDFDHIGIIVAVKANIIITAEGNFHNQSGIFERPQTDCIHGYIRLDKF